MRSIVPISALLLGALTLLPAVALAEAVTATAGASAEASGTVKPPVPPTVDSYSFGASNAGSMGSGGGHGSGRMTASGTKPVPKAIEERMQERDAMHAKLSASTSPSDCIGDPSGKTDCMEQGRDATMKHGVVHERVEIFSRFTATMIGRMNAAINRLKKIADRLDSRITKEKARGVDTTKAEANIAIARVKIADAETAVTLAANIVSSTTASIDLSSTTTRPSDIGKPVREALTKAREAIFAAHKALVDAISSLTGVVTSPNEQSGDAKSHGKSSTSTTVSGSASTSVTH